MRSFKQYLSESFEVTNLEELKAFIHQNCQQALDYIQQNEIFFYRGMDRTSLTDEIEDAVDIMLAGEVVVRKDRRPRNTPQFAHDVADDWFHDKFDFRTRSQALFVIGNEREARSYGTLCIVLPIGSFTTYSSTKIDDLTQKLFPDHDWESSPGLVGGQQAWASTEGEPSIKDQESLITTVLNDADYKVNDIAGMQSNTNMEIMIKCDRYLAIHCNDDDYLRSFLKDV